MAQNILVTGAAGFFGSYVCRHISNLSTKHNVIGTNIIKADDIDCESFIPADISDAAAVDKLIKQTSPDCIIHLAGTFGSKDSLKTYQVNTLSAAAILEAVCRHVPGSVVITAGSAAEYGKVHESRLPIGENCPCEPVTPYGLSKLLATQISLYYHRACGLSVTVVRPFQLIGKGMTDRLAPGAFAKQLKDAISSHADTIKVGNLESCRDFLDVRDAAEAIWMLCQKPAPGEILNLCSGKPTKMADLLRTMIEVAQVRVKIETDPALLRGSADVSVVYGSYKKINNHCKWKPRTNLTQSIREMFD